MKRNLLRSVFALCVLASIAFLVALPLSYRYYTSVGIDTDRLDSPEWVYYRYYRLRWPGDGTFRIGGGAMHYARGTKPLEPFDLAASLFEPPRIEPPQTVWNRLGFWRVESHGNDGASVRNPSLDKPWQSWVGVPSVLPTVVFLVVTWLLRRVAARRKGV